MRVSSVDSRQFVATEAERLAGVKGAGVKRSEFKCRFGLGRCGTPPHPGVFKMQQRWGYEKE
jgi:hypothetical protein